MHRLLKITLLSPLLFSSAFAFGQTNLVPNPSFENNTGCPSNFDQIFLSVGWNSFGSTPDYFHSCATPTTFSIPYNTFGFQNSATGQAYAGIYSYYYGASNIREYAGCQLITPMIIGQKYFVTVKASLALSGSYSNCATNKMGVLFSTVQYNNSNPAPISNFAHIYSSSIINDTLNWTVISGSFIADSSYQYVITGNFFDDSNTSTQLLGDTICNSYYYIDDICTSTDSLSCSPTGINSVEQNNFFKLFPNPTNGIVIISFKEKGNIFFSLFDITGKVILDAQSQQDDKNSYCLDLSEFSSGIYFLKVQTEFGSSNRKFFLVK